MLSFFFRDKLKSTRNNFQIVLQRIDGTIEIYILKINFGVIEKKIAFLLQISIFS